MSGKKKYSNELKLAIVTEYLLGNSGGYEALSKKHGISSGQIRHWVNLYNNGGTKGLSPVQYRIQSQISV